jgi:hypothetical protein
MYARIVTRPDFDGVICAVLLKKALGESIPVAWTQPADVQGGIFTLHPQDVVANLPLTGKVGLWFDHHVSNTTDIPFTGAYCIAPSAARVVYDYFKERMEPSHRELVRQADKIDAAQLVLDEIIHPERYPYVLLSMTIPSGCCSEDPYCDHLVHLLGRFGIDRVMADPIVERRCEDAVAANKTYESFLQRYTRLQDHVSITDFRSLTPSPDGNRFMIYALFPQTCVNVKLLHEGAHVAVKLGHSILNPCCRVNVGKLLSHYNGGGHRGAGAARLDKARAEGCIEEIIAILMRNQPNE